MNWMLISVFERDITTELFEDWTETNETMRERFEQARDYGNYDGEFDDNDAWARDCYNYDYTWKIVQINKTQI